MTRAALPGLTLVTVLLAVAATMWGAPGIASAATLAPCTATEPTGPIVNLDGELTLVPGQSTRRLWGKNRIRQALIKPANRLTGRPTYPVKSVKYGSTSKIRIGGGIKYARKRRSVALRNLVVIAPDGRKKPILVRASVAGKVINFVKVPGGKRNRSTANGTFNGTGTARLTAAGAKLLNKRLRPVRKLKPGAPWGKFNLFSLYTVTEVEDPEAETPEVPPVKGQPVSSYPVVSAATIKWFVRDTFINYVNTGQGTRAEDGATADPPTGASNLVYSFNFPFSSGWTVPAGEQVENTLIKGRGLVGFRYCQNTINFTVSDPELEIGGDENSRLIFHVNGTDGTSFPDQRAVMVKLVPSGAESHSVVDNGDGTKTVTYVHMPGYIPAEATGIFAGFYRAYDPTFVTSPNSACPDAEGNDGICSEANRPDRFGSFTVSYTFRYS